MKIGQDLWGIVTSDETVAGDGECPCLHYSREAAEEEVESLGKFLRGMNQTDELKVVRVRLVAVEELPPPTS